MHAYLKTIGFSKIKTTKELQEILRDVVENYDRKKIVETEEHHLFAEFSKEYAYDCGITVCGEIDENNRFQMEYYYPYFEGGQISSYEEVSVERHVDKESFAGACDDMRLGITMIFYLTHAAEYLEMKQKNALQPLPLPLSAKNHGAEVAGNGGLWPRLYEADGRAEALRHPAQLRKSVLFRPDYAAAGENRRARHGDSHLLCQKDGGKISPALSAAFCSSGDSRTGPQS